MKAPDKLYFMPRDAEDEAGIELGDGRVLQLHPCDDTDADLLRAVVLRYNNFTMALEHLKLEHAEVINLQIDRGCDHDAQDCGICERIKRLEEV